MADMLCGSFSFTRKGVNRCGSLLSPSVASFASLSAFLLPSVEICVILPNRVPGHVPGCSEANKMN